MAAKELWHDTAQSVNTNSQRVVHVHSPLIDTERSNPLILPISCRRPFFSAPPCPPRGSAFFASELTEHLRGRRLWSRCRTSNPLCVFVCLFASSPAHVSLFGEGRVVLKKTKLHPPHPAFATLKCVVMPSIFGYFLC